MPSSWKSRLARPEASLTARDRDSPHDLDVGGHQEGVRADGRHHLLVQPDGARKDAFKISAFLVPKVMMLVDVERYDKAALNFKASTILHREMGKRGTLLGMWGRSARYRGRRLGGDEVAPGPEEPSGVFDEPLRFVVV